MNLLIDTHILIWSLAGSEDLSAESRKLLESPENQILVSSISIWEIITKVQIGKLKIPQSFEESILEQGFQVIPFSQENALAIFDLPLHHRDPFDRALLAQAKSEKLRFLTADHILELYQSEVDMVWAK